MSGKRVSSTFKSIRSKLFAGDLIIILLLLFVSFWSISNFINLSNALDDILVENYMSVLAAENMVGAIERQDSAVLFFIQGQEELGQKLFDEYHNNFMIWYGREEENITVPGEGDVVKRLRNEYKDYLSDFNSLKRIHDQYGEKDAMGYYLSTVYPRFMAIREICDELLELNHKTIVERDKIAKKVGSKAIWSTVIVSVISVILASFWNIYSSGAILKPILKLTEKVKRITQGNVYEHIDIKSNDEIGILAMEFNKMTQHIKAYQDMNIDKLISERKKSETIVREITDGIIVVDQDARITLVNKAAEMILGKDEKQVLGKHFLEISKEEFIFHKIKNALSNIEEEHMNEDISTISRVFNGSKKYYTVEVSKIEGSEDKISGAVIVLGDVTHFKEVDEMKSDFVSIVSHEFRTPLTSIQMGVGLLLESGVVKDNTKEHELLSAIEEDSQRLSRLVTELLDLSKLESGKVKMEFRPINVEGIIKTVLKSFELQLKEKKINIKEEGPADGLPLAYADEDKIQLVLSNLVSNALRYTPENGYISIMTEASGNKVYVSVKDTGIGIPKKFQDIIFDKFTQVKNDGVNVGGAGLGLAISKDIIKEHKGRIWVESTEGEGSKFTFTLPIYRTIPTNLKKAEENI